MKQLTWKLVLPLTVISFTAFTKLWVVEIDDFGEILRGFPLPYACPGWHTSLSLQIFVFELIVDITTYFAFWFLVVLTVTRIIKGFRLPKVVTITLLSTSGFCTIVLVFFAAIPDHIYTVTRKFEIKIKETRYRFVWQRQSLVSTDNFPDPEGLKFSIAQGISDPFNAKDTLVYDSFLGICGNSSQDEISRYYEPHLNESPYLAVLKKQHPGPVVVTGDSLHNIIMTRFRTTKVGCESPWDCFSNDKVQLSIFGEAVTNSAVKINEMYTYKGLNRSFEKLFSYKDGKWTFKTLSDNKHQTTN